MMDPQSFKYCEDMVRSFDKDRFLACLFAPVDARPALFVIYAFNVEVTRVRDLVSDPLPGEMRLQWWRDAISGRGHGDVDRHPVASALLHVIRRYDLPVVTFLDYLEARTFDIYDDPMPTLNDLEGYAGETSSALMQLAALILDRDHAATAATAAGHGGVALTITMILRAFPRQAARGQLFVPMDVLEKHNVSRQEALSGTPSKGLTNALQDLRETARDHIETTREELPSVHPAVMTALLQIALAPSYLDRLKHAERDPFRTLVDLPQWQRQWILWRSARRAARR